MFAIIARIIGNEKGVLQKDSFLNEGVHGVGVFFVLCACSFPRVSIKKICLGKI